jgi:hypothetical protein
MPEGMRIDPLDARQPAPFVNQSKDQTVRFHLLHAKCGSRVRKSFLVPGLQ